MSIKSLFLAATLICTSLSSAAASKILPITGSFINLFYQDVRNKYSNPQFMDNTDPELWKQKIIEMHNMGIEYVVFMATANEGRAAYPSKIMPLAYNPNRTSPVETIMNIADSLDMKIFMSIGWAKDQDDNLRDSKILNRQIEIMEELAKLYGTRKSFYGWYLPVEDCLGPVLSNEAVTAVNALVKRANKITPGARTMISPYGMSICHFDDPQFAKQINKLKVDIIAYQDEIGCKREDYPLSNLRKNWKRLKEIHDKNHIEMWANCEIFAWEKDLNDRTSALIPAAIPRVLSQLSAASQNGAQRIISFMVYGIWDSYTTDYSLGQPHVSKLAADEYASWRKGEGRYPQLAASFTGDLKSDKIISGNYAKLFDNKLGDENVTNNNWMHFPKGKCELVIPTSNLQSVNDLFIRFLNSSLDKIVLPTKVYFYTSNDGNSYQLESVIDTPYFPNTKDDCWIDGINIKVKNKHAHFVKLAFDEESEFYIDEIFVNPSIR